MEKKKKKRIGGIAICPNKLGEVFLIDPILLGRALARAKPLSSPSSWQVWQLSRIHSCHSCLDKSLTKWSFPLFRSANASSPYFNWTFNNPFLSLSPSLQSTCPPGWCSNGRIKRKGMEYFPFFFLQSLARSKNWLISPPRFGRGGWNEGIVE